MRGQKTEEVLDMDGFGSSGHALLQLPVSNESIYSRRSHNQMKNDCRMMTTTMTIAMKSYSLIHAARLSTALSTLFESMADSNRKPSSAPLMRLDTVSSMDDDREVRDDSNGQVKALQRRALISVFLANRCCPV